MEQLQHTGQECYLDCSTSRTTEKLNTTQQRAAHRPAPAGRGIDRNKATKPSDKKLSKKTLSGIYISAGMSRSSLMSKKRQKPELTHAKDILEHNVCWWDLEYMKVEQKGT